VGQGQLHGVEQVGFPGATDVLNPLHQHLGIGTALKGIALLQEFLAQHRVIFNDPVVDQGQVCHFPLGLVDCQLVCRVDDGQARAVVAAVFQAFEAFKEYGNGLPGSDVSYDAAHVLVFLYGVGVVDLWVVGGLVGWWVGWWVGWLAVGWLLFGGSCTIDRLESSFPLSMCRLPYKPDYDSGGLKPHQVRNRG